MSFLPRGLSALTVACGMLGMGQTVVMPDPMLIVNGTVFVKNRLEAERGEREEGDRKGGWKRRRKAGGKKGMEKEAKECRRRKDGGRRWE